MPPDFDETPDAEVQALRDARNGKRRRKPAVDVAVVPPVLIPVPGPQGPAGPQGERGTTGARGLDAPPPPYIPSLPPLNPPATGAMGPPGPAGMPGEPGQPGPRGWQGEKGWSPLLSAQPDGNRTVLRVVDWIGGEGAKPEAGQFIGPDGFVIDPSNATDIRGMRGDRGPAGHGGFGGGPSASTITAHSIPAGGLAGQVLIKLSNADYDVAWGSVSGDVILNAYLTEAGDTIITESGDQLILEQS